MLSNLSFSLKLLLTTLFKRQRLHDFDQEDFLKMNCWISNSLFWPFKIQINFESPRWFSCVPFLKDIAWLLYLDLNSVLLIPSLVSISALWAILPVSFNNFQHLLSNGQFCLYPNDCMFYHLFRCKNLLSLCYDYWLCFLYYLCNYN